MQLTAVKSVPGQPGEAVQKTFIPWVQSLDLASFFCIFSTTNIMQWKIAEEMHSTEWRWVQY